MAKLSPVFNDQTIDVNGDPYVGAQLFTYTAGSSTKQVVYTDAAGTIPHANPIILNSLGFPTQGAIWIQEGISVKFVLASPTDIDPPTSPIKTIDNVQGVNDASVSVSEWQASGVIPTYISTVSFSLPGDQTTEFQKGRRAQFTTSGGTKYGKIINSVFTTLTTVTMLMDGTDVLDGGLSVVNLSLLHKTPSALPNPIEFLRSSVVATATTTPMWDDAYGEYQDWSVAAITALPAAPRPGSTRHVFPAAGASIANGGSITVQGGGGVVAEAGDEWVITAPTTTTFTVRVIKKSGIDVNVIPNHLSGLQCSPAGGSATMPISAGIAADSTNAVMMKLLTAFTKTTATWALGTGNGGKLSAAAMANDTWYHFFLIYRSDTGVADIGFDVSTTPTLPIGYTHYRRIFSALTNGSAQWLKIVQTGNNFDLDVPIINYNNITSQGAAAVTRVASVPTGIVVEAKLNMNLANSGTGSAMLVSSLAVADTAPSSGNSTLNVSFFSNSGASGQVRVMTNTSAQYRTRLTSGGADVSQSATTIGWIDTRGRDA